MTDSKKNEPQGKKAFPTDVEFRVGVSRKNKAVAVEFSKEIKTLLLTPEAAINLGVSLIGRSTILTHIIEADGICRNLTEIMSKPGKNVAYPPIKKDQKEEPQDSKDPGQ